MEYLGLETVKGVYYGFILRCPMILGVVDDMDD